MKVLLNPVAVKTMLNIVDGCSMSSVLRKTGSNYPTTSRLINHFEKLKLIKSVKIGRIREITLTKNGRSVREHLGQIK